MISTIEIRPTYDTSGTHPVVEKSMMQNFQDWLQENPDLEIISVNRNDQSILVVYKRKIEKSISSFGNKRK